MKTTITTSIIICTRDRAEHLRETLKSVAGLHVPSDMPTELLVVDNGSSCTARKITEEANLHNVIVRYVHERTPGQCHARNRGLAEARGEIVLFTDDDVRVPETWISGMCAPLLGGLAHGVAGGIRIAPHLCRPWMTTFHKGYLASTEGLTTGDPGSMVGANMAFVRSACTIVKEFDTDLGPGALGFGDDTLFGWQMKHAGLKLVGLPDVEIEHHPDPSRLARQHFLNDAAKRGRTRAYLSHHWYHEVVNFPGIRAIRSTVKLQAMRAARRGEWRYSEGAPIWELVQVDYANYYRQLIVEQRKARKYGEKNETGAYYSSGTATMSRGREATAPRIRLDGGAGIAVAVDVEDCKGS